MTTTVVEVKVDINHDIYISWCKNRYSSEINTVLKSGNWTLSISQALQFELKFNLSAVFRVKTQQLKSDFHQVGLLIESFSIIDFERGFLEFVMAQWVTRLPATLAPNLRIMKATIDLDDEYVR